ncbi:hypothetical protein SAMN04487935_3852, partial [Flavobacterium noncentrifugens]
TGNFVFTEKVLSWQRKLSPLESQPRLSRETLPASASEIAHKKIVYEQIYFINYISNLIFLQR